MDKSKMHIAMADCPEIQDQWEPAFADYVKSPQGTVEIITMAYGVGVHEKPYCLGSTLGRGGEAIFKCNWTNVSTKELSRYIWLPRQDQYWDMVADSLGCIHERGYWCQDCHDAIGEFMREDHPSIINLLMSKTDAMTREVVLLAFYMKEAHGKIWDAVGMKWKKQDQTQYLYKANQELGFKIALVEEENERLKKQLERFTELERLRKKQLVDILKEF